MWDSMAMDQIKGNILQNRVIVFLSAMAKCVVCLQPAPIEGNSQLTLQNFTNIDGRETFLDKAGHLVFSFH